MNKMNAEIDIKNENEILRVYEHNLQNAKSDSERSKINSYIDRAKKEISNRKAAAGLNQKNELQIYK